MKTEPTLESLQRDLARSKKLLKASRAKVRRLSETVKNLKDEVQENSWQSVRVATSDNISLPLPRLEMRWVPTDGKWDRYRVEYYLVKAHLLGEIREIPLGETTSSRFGEGKPWVIPGYDPTERVDLPYRDGAHLCFDAYHLGLPAYGVTPDGVFKIPADTYGPYQATKGKSTRRS